MKLKCLVIDDDPLICDLIQHFCSKVKQIDFCIAADNALDGLSIITSQPLDVMFLDYNLPDLNAKSLLELKQTDTPVVMITSHSAFAVESYNFKDIIDFIAKPITFERFYQSIEKVIQKQIKASTINHDTDKTLFVKDGNKLIRLQFDQINFIKSESNYVFFSMKDKQIMSLISLKELENKLPGNFARIHRSYIVNLDKIDYITSEEIFVKEQCLPIGSKYKNDFLNKITEL